MRSLWRVLCTPVIVALLAPALAFAQASGSLTIHSVAEPQGGAAAGGATVALVAINLSSQGGDSTINGFDIQKVGSAPDSVIKSLQINDSATSTLATVAAQFNSSHTITIPLSTTLAAGQSKTFLVSATMVSADSLASHAGQSFGLNVTAINSASAVSGPLPVYGAQATIVSTLAKPTCTISANQSNYRAGDTINVSWHSTNATGGTITGIGQVAPSGLQGILPGGSVQTLVGTFTGPGGEATCQLALTRTDSGGYVAGDSGSAGGVGAPGSASESGSLRGSTPTTGNGGAASAPTGGTVSNSQGSGIIPCGNSNAPVGSPQYIADTTNCRPCDFAALAQNVINTLIGLSIPLAAAMFAWAGILYFTSAANPKNIGRAKSIFKVVFWGFLIAISAWLVIQIIVNAVVDKNFFNGGSWNSIQCVQGARAGAGGNYSNLGTLLSGTTGGIYIGQVTPVSVGQTSVFNNTFGNFTPQCDTSGGFSYDATSGQCINAVGDFVPPSGFNSATNGNIASAMSSYYGANTSAGPGGGNVACAWAVNNVLQLAGYTPIDANSVAAMEQQLQYGGRGAAELQPSAQVGDIVVFGGMSHVGMCANAGCTQVLSNSSSNASFTNVYPPTPGSRFYHPNP